jgi:hypothetical protein
MIYDIFVNCNWVATRWRWYSTHLHTNNTQNNTINNETIRITKKQHKQQIWKSAGRAQYLRVLPWHLPYNWGKSTSLELDRSTWPCEYFLAIADNITFQSIDFFSCNILHSSTNWQCHCMNSKDECTIPKHQIMFPDFSLKNLQGPSVFWFFTQP